MSSSSPQERKTQTDESTLPSRPSSSISPKTTIDPNNRIILALDIVVSKTSSKGSVDWYINPDDGDGLSVNFKCRTKCSTGDLEHDASLMRTVLESEKHYVLTEDELAHVYIDWLQTKATDTEALLKADMFINLRDRAKVKLTEWWPHTSIVTLPFQAFLEISDTSDDTFQNRVLSK
jgi:hypothetical protein